MEKKNIDTRLIKSIGYDKEKKVLEVEFSSNMVHQYKNFPQNLYTEMIEKKDIDKFFKLNIVNKYHYNRIK